MTPQLACIPALLAAVLLPFPGSAQSVPAARDPRVDSIFAAWDRPDSPGCALGVYRDGRIVYARGYGMADLERQVPITAHSVFDIGSTSKQFTAASILLLEREGKLSLDDDVRRHVPELPEYSRPITIRHLLHHTSGIRDYIGLLTLAGMRIDDVTTAEDALRAIARQQELNFEPGTEHLYSNSGYFLLSIIVERVAGQSLRDFARERIFTPLRMQRTHYLGSYDDVVPDRALAYEPRADGLRSDLPRWLQLGDGAVFTTVEELLLWDENFYQPRVGDAALLEALHRRGVLTGGDTLDYALGLMHGEHRGQRTVSHGGSWGGYRAELLRFPDQHFSVAALCNLGTINPVALARRVADVYLADVLAPVAAMATAPAAQAASDAEPVAVPLDVLRALAGTYRQPDTQALLTMVMEGERLMLTVPGRAEFRPRNELEYDLVGAPVAVTVVFEPGVAGAPRALELRVAGEDPERYVQLAPFTPDAAALAGFAGRYFSEELAASYELVVREGALVLLRFDEELGLRPITRDQFAAGRTALRFQRDGAGAVSGFQLDVGRVRNLRFARVPGSR